MAEPKLEIERRMGRLEASLLLIAESLGVADQVEDILRDEPHSTKVDDGSSG